MLPWPCYYCCCNFAWVVHVVMLRSRSNFSMGWQIHVQRLATQCWLFASLNSTLAEFLSLLASFIDLDSYWSFSYTWVTLKIFKFKIHHHTSVPLSHLWFVSQGLWFEMDEWTHFPPKKKLIVESNTEPFLLFL